jgi:hypothetical protein
MCGLVGVVNKENNGFTFTQKEVFNTLIFLDTMRGEDSTGIFCVTNTGDIYGAKEATNAVAFKNSSEYDKILSTAFMKGSALIGHNRKATRGVVNDENAHPFVVDNNIVLVHNGTLMGDHKKLADVEVDSHAIAHMLHQNESVEDAMGKFHGAYALIWYDYKKQTLNFLRNNQRPLYWVETDDAYVWASEEIFLKFAAEKHNLKIVDGPYQLKEDTLATFSLEDRGWEVNTVNLNIKREELPQQQYTTNFSIAYPHYYHEYDADDVNYSGIPGTPEWHKSVSSAAQVTNATVKSCEEFMVLSNNRLITNEEYMQSIINEYPFDKKVLVMPFDYTYVNGINDAAGYYLYCHPPEDDKIFFRHWLSNKVSEERILSMASGDYIFEIGVGAKSWTPIKESTKYINPKDERGYVIIQSNGFKMVHSPQNLSVALN